MSTEICCLIKVSLGSAELWRSHSSGLQESNWKQIKTAWNVMNVFKPFSQIFRWTYKHLWILNQTKISFIAAIFNLFLLFIVHTDQNWGKEMILINACLYLTVFDKSHPGTPETLIGRLPLFNSLNRPHNFTNGALGRQKTPSVSLCMPSFMCIVYALVWAGCA